MRITKKVKDWLSSLGWVYRAEEEFNLKIASRDETLRFIKDCADAYEGHPFWEGDGIRTINVAETVCAEVARLSTLNIGINITGSERADYLQEEIDKVKPKLRQWVEYGCANGEIIIKPNGYAVDIVYPSQYIVTEEVGKEIVGIVFTDGYYNSREERYYTRLEYHRIENGKYYISNRCYIGDEEGDLKRRVDIKETIWKDLSEDIVAEGVDKMLFGIFRLPTANNLNPRSSRSLPIFANAMEELSDADVAYSRMTREIYDSKRTVLLDSDRLMAGNKSKLGLAQKEVLIENAGLPDFVKMIDGNGSGDIYHEINPTLNTEARIRGLNTILSQIGYKCGFSNGYFVFNEKTGMVTATQVESDDRRTLQLIGDVRAQLEACMEGLIYAIDRFADAYDLAPSGKYEVAFDFADITENVEEDKMRWFSYVQSGYVPFWYYLVKFEGYTEEEAKEVGEFAREAQMEQMQAMALFAPPQ